MTEEDRKKAIEVIERSRKEQEEIERELERLKQERLADMQICLDHLRRIIEKLELKELRLRTKNRNKRMRKYLFLSKYRRFLRFLVGKRIANRAWLHMIMKDETFRECIAEGSDDNV